MNKKIKIDGQEMEFMANAGTTILFKRAFKTDLMSVIQSAVDGKANSELLDIIPQLAYIMNLQATKGGQMSQLMTEATEDNYYDWLCQFGGGAFLDGDVINKITELWLGTNATTSKSKNSKALRQEK